MDILRDTPGPEIREQTPLEKLKETIESLNEYQQDLSFVDILLLHIKCYPKDFHACEMSRIIRELEFELYCKIGRLMGIADFAYERATWLKTYLEGKMFTSEEAAREHLPMQVTNANDIIEKCKERWK